jgi:hypothetical protein
MNRATLRPGGASIAIAVVVVVVVLELVVDAEVLFLK